MENRQHEEVSQFQFSELLRKFEGLTERKSLIERLRETYFDALRTGDEDSARSAIQDAKAHNVELFEDMPLGQVEELAAIQLLAKQLKDSGLPDPAALASLKGEDPIALQEKLGLLTSVVTRLQELGGPEELAKLDDATAKAKRWLRLDRAVADLILLRMMAIREYDREAGAILTQLQADMDVANELKAEIGVARSEYVSWQNLRAGIADLVTRLEAIEQKVNDRSFVTDQDRQWLASLAVQARPTPPGVLVRLLQPLQSRDPITIKVSSELSQEQRDFCRQLSIWWEKWKQTSETRSLDQVKRDLEGLEQTVFNTLSKPSAYAFPGAQEALLGWQTRLGQAQRLAADLDELERGLYLSSDSESNRAVLRYMNRLVDIVPDEVYVLFHDKWKRVFEGYVNAAKNGQGNSSEKEKAALTETLDEFHREQTKRFGVKSRRGTDILDWFSKPSKLPSSPNGDY